MKFDEKLKLTVRMKENFKIFFPKIDNLLYLSQKILENGYSKFY